MQTARFNAVSEIFAAQVKVGVRAKIASEVASQMSIITIIKTIIE